MSTKYAPARSVTTFGVYRLTVDHDLLDFHISFDSMVHDTRDHDALIAMDMDFEAALLYAEKEHGLRLLDPLGTDPLASLDEDGTTYLLLTSARDGDYEI